MLHYSYFRPPAVWISLRNMRQFIRKTRFQISPVSDTFVSLFFLVFTSLGLMMNIGIDLGGTKIKAGIEYNGEIIHQKKAFLKEKDSFNSTIDQVFRLISPLTQVQVGGIGIGRSEERRVGKEYRYGCGR